MGVCITCANYRDEKQFSIGSPICKLCVNKLVELHGVNYVPPKKKPIIQAHLSLLLAIRKQAIQEKDLEGFEKNWLYASPWNQIMEAIKHSAVVRDEFRNTVDLLLSEADGL